MNLYLYIFSLTQSDNGWLMEIKVPKGKKKKNVDMYSTVFHINGDQTVDGL
jgi:hypothetical protein